MTCFRCPETIQSAYIRPLLTITGYGIPKPPFYLSLKKLQTAHTFVIEQIGRVGKHMI